MTGRTFTTATLLLIACSVLPALAGAQSANVSSLKPPASGSIPVAFVVSQGAVVIDYSGPWEVFQDTMLPGRDGAEGHLMPFRLYTVAESTQPITVSGGMKIVPDYSFENTPAPKIIVIPAQHGASDAMLAWIRKSSATADLTMSVCTGAFILAQTGLLKGKGATTHHASYKSFGAQFPDVRLKRGFRFVEEGNIATAGGLTSGIDLALRVVERYYGHHIAERTASYMEYQGEGWMDASGSSNAVYLQTATADPGTDPVCGMPVDSNSPASSTYKGRKLFFCSEKCKSDFDAAPGEYLSAARP